MKEPEINQLKMLDPDGLNGTIQAMLMNPSICEAPYSAVLYNLLKSTLTEREYFYKDNMKLVNILMANGLYTSEIILGNKL